jgi:hypothetical protein
MKLFDLQQDGGLTFSANTTSIAQNDFFIFFETSLGGLTNFYKQLFLNIIY